MLNVKKTLTKILTKDKVLFYDASPSMGNSPSLSDSISNYDVFDIYLVDNDGNYAFTSVTRTMPQSHFIVTLTKGNAGNTEVYIKSAAYSLDTVNNKIVYNSSSRHVQGAFSGGSQSVANGAYIGITKVIGRKLGGVIRTLKKAISNLYREGVAVC